MSVDRGVKCNTAVQKYYAVGHSTLTRNNPKTFIA